VSKETLPLGTARVGLRIEAESIRILPETAKLCIDFGLNPLGAISSGSLLICLDPAFERRTFARLRTARIPVARIGTVVHKREGVMLIDNHRVRPFPRFAVDEVARFFQARR
jgi:hydrogenase maturation factor